MSRTAETYIDKKAKARQENHYTLAKVALGGAVVAGMASYEPAAVTLLAASPVIAIKGALIKTRLVKKGEFGFYDREH